VAVVMFATSLLLTPSSNAQTNSWTSATSGNWEDTNSWSLGQLPGSGQTILLTNAGFKAVQIRQNTAAKFSQTLAVDSLTIGLAREVAAEGIRVNAVRPGVIYTDIHASGGEPGRVERVKSAVPMQRGGEAGEVARAILWLLSDESSYCTGTFVDVSGGR